MLNSGSETFDLSRHDSYRMHKRSDDNDESFTKGSLKIWVELWKKCKNGTNDELLIEPFTNDV